MWWPKPLLAALALLALGLAGCGLQPLYGSTASGSRLAANTLDLVSTMLHSELDLAAGSMKPQALLATSVRDYIEANLADPQLSPASIAAAHFISTRHLHNVFHESGSTVASWIRSRRLERVRRDLRDPLHSGTSVGAVAARWGFLDAAHFSRLFRAAYGCSPREFRAELLEQRRA